MPAATLIERPPPPPKLDAPARLTPEEVPPKLDDVWYSARRYFVDEFYTRHVGSLAARARVLDVGGKKTNKRGQFDIGKFAVDVKYLNLDRRTEPDIVGDACAIPVEAGSFDAVVLSEVVEHLPRPDLALREAARVLRPGGVLLACAPFIYQVHPDPLDVGRYAPDWWAARLAEAGFAEAAIEPQGMYLSVLADMLRAWACDLEDRKAFYPGIRGPAMKFVRWIRETAFEHERKGHWAPESFYGQWTTGYGVRAVR